MKNNKFVFKNCEKYIVQWSSWETCWDISFHVYPPNIRLQKDKCSQ